jgi:hypothetical protein
LDRDVERMEMVLLGGVRELECSGIASRCCRLQNKNMGMISWVKLKWRGCSRKRWGKPAICIRHEMEVEGEDSKKGARSLSIISTATLHQCKN